MFAGPSLTTEHRGDCGQMGLARLLSVHHPLVGNKLQLSVIAPFLEQAGPLS